MKNVFSSIFSCIKQFYSIQIKGKKWDSAVILNVYWSIYIYRITKK